MARLKNYLNVFNPLFAIERPMPILRCKLQLKYLFFEAMNEKKTKYKNI